MPAHMIETGKVIKNKTNAVGMTGIEPATRTRRLRELSKLT